MKVSYLTMSSYEGPAPGIDIWPVAPKFCNAATSRLSVDNAVEMARFAEELGFDWVSVAEHHYAAYMMTPNPIVLAAALSQVVRKARIALLGPLVPLNNPVRLAEEVAMLDNLTNGRVVVLFLRGTPNEHNTYDTPKEDTRGMTQEGIDLIMKAWREEDVFSWDGHYYKFSNISVWPRIQQYPHPPMYGSGNSEESVIFAAQRKMGIAFSFAPPEMVDRLVKLYHAECTKAGWQPTRDNVLYRGIACVGDTDHHAGGIFESYLGVKAKEKAYLQSETMGGPPLERLVLEPYFLGGVNTVLDRFKALHDVGVGVVDMGFSVGNIEQRKTSLRVFSNKVLPAIRHELAVAV